MHLLFQAFSGGYYRGGCEPKMTKWEIALILSVSPTAKKTKKRDAHWWIMLLNHPDKGGSLYIMAKINEAKDFLEGQPKKWSKCMMNFQVLTQLYIWVPAFCNKIPQS